MHLAAEQRTIKLKLADSANHQIVLKTVLYSDRGLKRIIKFQDNDCLAQSLYTMTSCDISGLNRMFPLIFVFDSICRSQSNLRLQKNVGYLALNIPVSIRKYSEIRGYETSARTSYMNNSQPRVDAEITGMFRGVGLSSTASPTVHMEHSGAMTGSNVYQSSTCTRGAIVKTEKDGVRSRACLHDAFHQSNQRDQNPDGSESMEAVAAEQGHALYSCAGWTWKAM